MRTFLPPPHDFDAEEFARTAAPAIGLDVDPKDLSDIAMNLSRTAGFAALIARVPGVSNVEPAPVFRASDWCKK